MNNYVVCLKWGEKYSSEYVNKLNSMVERNLTLPYQFVCFTENKKQIDPKIRIEKLPRLPVTGWWYKLWFLSKELPLDGNILFLDLDLIVFRNINNLFEYQKSQFCIIRDFNRVQLPSWDRVNSSVMRFESHKYSYIYDKFAKDFQHNTRSLRGDQDFIYKHLKGYSYWPEEWIQSYKWEMRDRSQLGVVNGERNFLKPGVPVIKKDTSIAVFHGEPNIDNCVDEWPKAHWG